MARLFIQKTSVLITCGSKALTCNTGEDCFQLLDISNIGGKCITRTGNFDADKKVTSGTEVYVVAADISSCEKYICICTSDKLLSLWETKNLSVISHRMSVRVASKVRFIPTVQEIILADKSGLVYSFSVEKPHEDGRFLLGHQSILLDILVSPDEKYIITCDRDEKIRVCRYPNTYNIQSYCLGHKEFITGLSFLPTDKTVLVSSSGDGTVRLWNYVTGIQLHVIDCKDSVSANSDVVDDSKTGHGDSVLPIRHITCCSIDTTTSLVCACISKFQGCLLYQIKCDSDYITSDLMQVLKLQAEPWDISLTLQRELWVLQPVRGESLCIFVWDCTVLQFVASSGTSVMAQVNSRWDLFQSIAPTKLLPVLYKRKFDKIQTYQERKKQRLASGVASSCSNTPTK
jgi:tRNA (guanine-N(7)-)-methyltransferase subunit TRM82